MENNFYITQAEKDYLRELAKKYMNYAHLPIMEERKKLWYAHNSLKSEKPVIVMEMDTFEPEMMPKPKCETASGRIIERNLLKPIINHELIDDDKVISDYYTVYWDIHLKEFNTDIKIDRVKDVTGRELGFLRHHPIKDLERDFNTIENSTFSVDREYTLAFKAFVEEIIGAILPVKIKNSSLAWYVTPSEKVVKLMGLETMMYSMLDYPAMMHKLYNFLKDDIKRFVKWQEEEGLLTLNNENDYAGAGSYGFSDELPGKDYKPGGKVRMKDIWINMNSQETVGISPEMYKEFIFPYYYDLAKEFGLTYYGCCEPVHNIWEECISKLPGLRKVSVSPWCNEEYMGNALKGTTIIYSRKPSPNFIGVGKNFDEAAFSKHIAKTLHCAKGGKLEFIFRDVYTLSGNINSPRRAVEITRKLIEDIW